MLNTQEQKIRMCVGHICLNIRNTSSMVLPVANTNTLTGVVCFHG